MTEAAQAPTVLVTGVGGQDAGYLLEQLAQTESEVHGLVRRPEALSELRERFPRTTLHLGDLKETDKLKGLVSELAPHRIFNLAGSTSVARSWSAPVDAADVMGVGPIRLLSAAWELQESTGREVRFLQASSAEIFGDPSQVPQTEGTPLAPVTPYGAAKAFAHEMAGVYRRRGLFASTAILYNHESPRRPESFVARKITRGVAAISMGLEDSIALGNIDVLRDWGYAPDYVDAMIRILGAERPDDYVVATGEAHTVRDFIMEAFSVVGIEDWHPHVTIDASLYRPADPKALVGTSERLRGLGWAPTLGFRELVRTMVDADLAELAGARDAQLAEQATAHR